MKQLAQKLEEFFSSFDSAEAIDLTAYRSEILDLLSKVLSEHERMTTIITESQDSDEENAELRRIIANDCRAKLILLGDTTAEAIAEELVVLPLVALQKERSAILKRFDTQFSLSREDCPAEPAPNDLALIDLQAFQS